MARKRQCYYSKSEMRNMLNVDEFRHHVYMPNEVFKDFVDAFAEEELKRKSSTHIAFAYGYYYLANYMWRYAQYYFWDKASGSVPLNEGVVKKILGFPAESEQYTYLTKNRTGLLVKIGYIRKETDKPSRSIYNSSSNDLEFVYESEYPDIYGNNKSWKASMPVKAIWREELAVLNNYYNGTFYNFDNTHMIDIDIFIYCMTDAEIGVEGFYLYCFLKYMTDKFKAFDCSNERMAYMTGLSLDEIKNQLKKLEQRNMITNDHKPYCLNKPRDKDTKTNTYGVSKYVQFARSKAEFKLIPKQQKISAERYAVEVGWANERHIDEKVIDTRTGEIIRNLNIDDEIDDMEDIIFD